MLQNKTSDNSDPYILLIEETKSAIPNDIRKVILEFEKEPLREEIVTQVYKNRYNPELDFYDVFNLVRPYIIANGIEFEKFKDEFQKILEDGLLIKTEHSPKVYTTAPLANECMKIGEILDKEIVESLCKEYDKNSEKLQNLIQFKDRVEAKRMFRSMIRSLLDDD